MNPSPIAERLSAAAVMMEGTAHPELAEALRIGADEIERLHHLVEGGKESVWHNRRFYFDVLKNPPNTPLAIIFNSILNALGQNKNSGESDEMYRRFYPRPPNEAPDTHG